MDIERTSPGQIALATIALGFAAAVAAVLHSFRQKVEKPSQSAMLDLKWPIPAQDSEEPLAV